MPLAGFKAAPGRLNFAGVVIAGAMASLAGAVFWYEIGTAETRAAGEMGWSATPLDRHVGTGGADRV